MKTNYFQVKFPSLPENISLSGYCGFICRATGFYLNELEKIDSRFLKLFQLYYSRIPGKPRR